MALLRARPTGIKALRSGTTPGGRGATPGNRPTLKVCRLMVAGT